LLIDIRFLPAMSFETLHTDLEQLAFEVADKRGLDVATQILGSGLPAMDTPEASEIAQHLTHITGKKTGSVAFGTEAPYYNSMQTETIVIGPGSINQAHQPDEFLPLAHIDPTIKMLEDLIDRFCMS
jgi:acetylornithine deacetylase